MIIYRKVHYIMIKVAIHLETAILNVCAPIDRTAKICEAEIDVMERGNRQIHSYNWSLQYSSLAIR